MFEEKIKIDYVPISKLKAHEKNPRNLTPKQEEDLTESIKRFGIADPILLNSYKGRENVIVGGHQRVKVAKKLGFKTIPVVYLNLSPKKEEELLLRLNRNTGEWSWELLKEFDTDLLLNIGFDEVDMSNIWDDYLETENDDFSGDKEITEIKKTDIKLGDMFQLGNNFLICGDSQDPNTIKKLMGKEKADIILTDPPFNLNIDYDKGLGLKSNYGGDIDDNKSEAEYKGFIKTSLKNGLSVSKKDLHVFCYFDQKYSLILHEIFRELSISYKRTCLWIKNGTNIVPRVAFGKCYESVIYGTKGRPYLSNIKNLNEILNKEIDTGNRTKDDILDLLDIWLVKRLPGNLYSHPTEKPITLHEKALRRCSQVGDIVLDLFGGSGSILMSCHQLKRRCYTAEINPIFCQLIINRFESYEGKKAKKIS